MKFGLLYLLSTPKGKTDVQVYSEVLREVELAEELGFDTVWLTEHHFHDYGRPALAVLAGAVAARTEKIRIGTAVSILPLHHPIDVAEDFAAVDVLSNGRLEFGVGRGYQPAEFYVYGASLQGTREALEESLEIILKAWTQDEFTHVSKHYQIEHPISVHPKPLQKPHPPLWQPVVTPSTVESLVARGINPIFSPQSAEPDQFRGRYWTILAEAAAKAGKRVEDLDYAMNWVVHLANTSEKAKERGEGCMWWLKTFADLATRGIPGHDEYQASPERQEYGSWLRSLEYPEVAEIFAFIGDPESVAKKIEIWDRALGLKHLICYMHVGTIPHEAVMESMRLFAKEVMPAFRRGSGAN